MRRFTRSGALWALWCWVGWALPVEAQPSPTRWAAGVIAPDQFGKVFRRARPSIVQVRTSSSARTFDVGTVIGAEGELVFVSRAKPPDTVWIRASGQDHGARVLVWVEATGLAVARVGAGDRTPLAAAQPGDLALEEWVIAVRLDASGKPEPFAGTVERTERPHPRDSKLGVVEIATPAQPGSPILSANGGLIAFALDRGERRTRAVLLSSLVPFLRAVVLGP